MLLLRYPTLAGVPPGGSQPCVDATASIAFGRRYHTYYNTLAHSFLFVACVVLLLHVPRFPFHDSTGLEYISISYVKPVIPRKSVIFKYEKAYKHTEYQHLVSRGSTFLPNSPMGSVDGTAPRIDVCAKLLDGIC